MASFFIIFQLIAVLITLAAGKPVPLSSHNTTLSSRSTLSGCSPEDTETVNNALHRAADMARAAAKDARDGGTPLFNDYFHTDDAGTRQNVAERYDAVASEASSQGVLTYQCQAGPEDNCGNGAAAMTYADQSRTVNCPSYYSTVPVSNTCGYLDQAAVSLHELTHATSVFAPGTKDIAYGLDGVKGLSSEDALNNADSYAYYASAVFLQCGS